MRGYGVVGKCGAGKQSRFSVVSESHPFRGERRHAPYQRLQLEVLAQLAELFDRQQSTRWRRFGDIIVFEDPCIAVGDEDGVQSNGQRRIDVGSGAVSDHPGCISGEVVFRDR